MTYDDKTGRFQQDEVPVTDGGVSGVRLEFVGYLVDETGEVTSKKVMRVIGE